MKQEMIVQCDENGNIIGPIEKDYAHQDGTRQESTHYSTWSMIFNTSGKYGIQLKNKNKHDKYSGGKWDMGVAGHNCYVKKDDKLVPMNFKETLIKETEEEIGLNIEVIDSKEEFLRLAKSELKKPIAFIFENFHYKTERNNEYVGLAFILTPITELSFQDNEVVDFKWLFPEELSKFLKENNNYCSPLPLVFEKAEKFRKENFSSFN
ncbi:MAG: hypothetical protein ABIH82_04740 [Candidatus Woesearchaeota archaeon]